MIYKCLIKGDNIFRETNGVVKLMGCIIKVFVDVDDQKMVETLAMIKVRESDCFRELSDKDKSGIRPSISLMGISKSMGLTVQSTEFAWFPMSKLV